MIKASALAPGTCGELVQGSIDGIDFLVTCPVDIFSKVDVTLTRGENIIKCDPNRPKTAQAVRRSLIRYSENFYSAYIEVKSGLPTGKGMGSSSADISAAVAATARALGYEVNPDEIADIALSIEASDGVMYEGITLFDHRQGRIRRLLGKPPSLEILVLDPGGEVDTLLFNRHPELRELNRKKERLVTEALNLVEEGLRKNDIEALGTGATISALAHQEILPKPLLENVIRLSKELGAVGVNVAHSGTVMGVLLDPRRVTAKEAEGFVRKRFPQMQILKTRLIGGGVRIKECNHDSSRAWRKYRNSSTRIWSKS